MRWLAAAAAGARLALINNSCRLMFVLVPHIMHSRLQVTFLSNSSELHKKLGAINSLSPAAFVFHPPPEMLTASVIYGDSPPSFFGEGGIEVRVYIIFFFFYPPK